MELRLIQACPQFSFVIGEDPVYLALVEIDVTVLSVRKVQLLKVFVYDLNFPSLGLDSEFLPSVQDLDQK